MPQITIGIPFYNCEVYLTNTIRSIYAQSFTDWEAIFMDDGSTDGSLKIVESVNDHRVKVYSDGTNLGIGARRKQIVDLTKTKYLAWLDADDMMHPDRLKTQYEFLENNPDIACVDSSCYIIDPNMKLLRLSNRTRGIIDPKIMAITPQMENTVMFARIELYRDFNFNPKHRRVEDWDVWIRASRHYRFYHLDEFLGYHLDADANQKPRIDREIMEPRYLIRTYLTYGVEYLGFMRCVLLTARLCVRTVYRIILIKLGLHRLFKSCKDGDTDSSR